LRERTLIRSSRTPRRPIEQDLRADWLGYRGCRASFGLTLVLNRPFDANPLAVSDRLDFDYLAENRQEELVSAFKFIGSETAHRGLLCA
jgi:hypothetical protein